MAISTTRILCLIVLFLSEAAHAQNNAPQDDGLAIPKVKVTDSPSKADQDYMMDLVAAVKRAKDQKKMVILYTGHSFHLKRTGSASPRIYFDRLVKDSVGLSSRRSEFVVCELFEFTPMHDAKGNFTREYARMIQGWFGTLHDKYDIRFLTPTINILDSKGVKLAGPFEGMQGFGEDVTAALKKIPKVQ